MQIEKGKIADNAVTNDSIVPFLAGDPRLWFHRALASSVLFKHDNSFLRPHTDDRMVFAVFSHGWPARSPVPGRLRRALDLFRRVFFRRSGPPDPQR